MTTQTEVATPEYKVPAVPVVLFTRENPACAEHYCKWCGFRGGDVMARGGFYGSRCRTCYRVAPTE